MLYFQKQPMEVFPEKGVPFFSDFFFTEKSSVFPYPLILALLFSRTCPPACISGLENTRNTKDFSIFSCVAVGNEFFSKENINVRSSLFIHKLYE